MWAGWNPKAVVATSVLMAFTVLTFCWFTACVDKFVQVHNKVSPTQPSVAQRINLLYSHRTGGLFCVFICVSCYSLPVGVVVDHPAANHTIKFLSLYMLVHVSYISIINIAIIAQWVKFVCLPLCWLSYLDMHVTDAMMVGGCIVRSSFKTKLEMTDHVTPSVSLSLVHVAGTFLLAMTSWLG